MKKVEQVFDRTWLELARREKGYTQAQVAEHADITTAFYNRVEKGMNKPRVDTAILITDFLKVSVRNFLNEKPIR